jgi:soluble epoxide hydrolase / lipid-phosphate phosphatase
MSAFPIEVTEHTVKSGTHTTFYLAAGPSDGPLIVFVHGWPELSISWRHQLPAFAALGFRAVAPDMRGYGRSSTYTTHGAFAQQHVVGDMIALIDSLGRQRAVWVGHDWGSPVVWNIASHHPERCVAVANLCVPYYTLERGLDACLELVNRDIYPKERYPAGQWEYQLHYLEDFAGATRAMDSNPYNLAKLLFRKGDPSGFGKPSGTAMVRINRGWFGGGAIPSAPRDSDVVSEADVCAYASALARNGFFGPNSYYMNHDANAAYADRAVNGGYLDMPALFLAAQYDYTCECITSRLAEPMRRYCRKLTESVVYSGHWMAQEKPLDVNAALARWLATSVSESWPVARQGASQ